MSQLKPTNKVIWNETVFLLLILISNILITGSFYPLLYIAAALLHECGHLIMISVFGFRRTEIKYVGIGIRIKNKHIFSYRQEIIIGAMGPITNLAISVIGILFLRIYYNELLAYFIMTNIMYALVNLVPLAPLDGYKILSNLLYLFLSYKRAKSVLKALKLILTLILTILLAALICNNCVNLSLMLILLALISNAVIQLLIGDRS